MSARRVARNGRSGIANGLLDWEATFAEDEKIPLIRCAAGSAWIRYGHGDFTGRGDRGRRHLDHEG